MYGPRESNRESGLDEFAVVLARAREGDASGWATLYDDVAPLVLAYLRGQRAPDPEDLLGEVMLQVVRDIDRFDGEHRGFRSWVLTLAHHRMIDAVRYRTRRPMHATDPASLPVVAADDDPAVEAAAGADLHVLLTHLDTLSDDQRAVLLLRIVVGLSVDETAEVMDRRPNAVTSLQHRALVRLRTRLVDQQATYTLSAQRALPHAGAIDA